MLKPIYEKVYPTRKYLVTTSLLMTSSKRQEDKGNTFDMTSLVD